MPISPATRIARFRNRLFHSLPLLILAALLGGCGGGGGASPDSAAIATDAARASSTTATSGGTNQNITVSGSVGDGPVTGATVTVYDASGAVLGTMVSDSAAGFRKSFQVRNSQYPLRFVAGGGIDLVTGQAPDFKMVSVMLRPADRTVNINPFSTLIVNTAQRMPGGLNGSNVAAARRTVLGVLGFGLDTSRVPDPITTPIDGRNVAHIVKASEALGELVRRTRDLITATGRSASGSSVVAALAADLVDGIVDGMGASGTDSTVSAVANVVSAQVLVEAMSNNLRVGGVIATNVIDQSIRSTHSGVDNAQLSGSVRINSQMIRQAGVALSAVRVLDSSTAVRTLEQKVASLAPDSTAGTVARVLPASSSGILAGATGKVADASRTSVTQINQVVFVQLDSGTSTAASTNTATTTTTTTTNTSTSTTTGTANTTNTGTTTSTNGSFSLTWTAPTSRSDGTPLSLSAIDGYRIYYGTRSGSYTANRNITDGTARSASVTGLASGTYYLVMTTYDTGGLESGYSPEVVKRVP